MAYEIRVRGRVTDQLLPLFEGFSARVEPVANVNVITGAIADQAALHGLLKQIESLGLELVDLRRLPGEP